MEFTEYITGTGDRLDLIAGEVYGNPHQWTDIINANPNLPIIDEYGSGIRIKIPIIPGQDAGITNNIDLPPWKQ